MCIDVPGILDLVVKKNLDFLVARELNRQYCEQFLITWYLLAKHLAWVQNHLMCFLKGVGPFSHEQCLLFFGAHTSQLPHGTGQGLPGRNSSVRQRWCRLAAVCALWHCTGTLLPLRMCPGSAINSPQQGQHSLNALPTVVTSQALLFVSVSPACRLGSIVAKATAWCETHDFYSFLIFLKLFCSAALQG